MKRFFYLLVFSILVFFTACQKEPKDSVFSIDLAAMYNELDIADEVSEQMIMGGVIVDSVFVYGESGNLVDKAGSVSSRLEQVSMNMQGLESGDYTLVAFQYFKSKDGQSVWFTSDTNKLSDLAIQHADVLIDGVCALGVSTESISVKNGSIEKTITPKAAGSIIDFQLDDYIKDSSIPEEIELPPVWLYGEKKVAGIYPGRGEEGRLIVMPDQPEVIGKLEAGESHKKYFTLMNGNELAVSIRLVSGNDYYSYYKDKTTLSPGSKQVCYYDFSPDTFYYGYLGTPEGAKEFKEEQAKGDCALYPYIQWGASKADVEKYLLSRTSNSTLEGKMKVLDTKTSIEYSIAPGLYAQYIFDSIDATNLSCVQFTFEGGTTLENVKAAMVKQGYKYLGRILSFLTRYYYLSPDGKTLFKIGLSSDVVYAIKGYESWIASFYPVKQEDLDMLGVTL